MKKILFLIFVQFSLLSLAEGVKINGLYYNLNSTSFTAEVTYYTNNSTNSSYVKGSVVIPESVQSGSNTYTVTSIGQGAFQNCDKLTNIEIPNSVTSIGISAFNKSGLQQVKISDFITNIEQYAFANSSLRAIEIGNSVVSIGRYAFHSNTHLLTLKLGSSIKEIGENAFYGCELLSRIEIPNSVIKIGEGAFNGCKALKGELLIPNSVSSIGKMAFSNCSFTSIIIGNSLTTLEQNTFNNNENLSNIIISSSVKTIGQDVFSNCENLISIYNYSDDPQGINSMFSEKTRYVGTLYVPLEAIEKYREADVWKDFYNIIPLSNIATKDATKKIQYLDNDGYEINNHALSLSVPVPEQKEGYQFLKWTVLQGDLDEGIRIQAQYVGEGTENNLFYLDKDGEEMHSHSVTLSLPEPEEIPGYTFQKWIVVGGDLDDGIHVQAQYIDNGVQTDVPSLEENDIPSLRKTIRNGQVFILKGDKVYDVSGKEVK